MRLLLFIGSLALACHTSSEAEFPDFEEFSEEDSEADYSMGQAQYDEPEDDDSASHEEEPEEMNDDPFGDGADEEDP